MSLFAVRKKREGVWKTLSKRNGIYTPHCSEPHWQVKLMDVFISLIAIQSLLCRHCDFQGFLRQF